VARILGKVEYGNSEQPRFFIHCDTAGGSFPSLFDVDVEAWRVYDSGGSEALRTAVPKRSKEIRVIRKLLAHARSFAPNGEIYGEPLWGLATDDRLITPIDSSGFSNPRYRFLEAEGVLHVAVEAEGGFSGNYDMPVCTESWEPRVDEKALALEDMFGKRLDLCPRCVAALTGANC